jgi:hypothetical protein
MFVIGFYIRFNPLPTSTQGLLTSHETFLVYQIENHLAVLNKHQCFTPYLKSLFEV